MRVQKLERFLGTLVLGLGSLLASSGAVAGDSGKITPLLAAGENPTIVMIMVDGTRPDVLEKMMADGELNNIKRYFMDGGSFFENSFTPLSLTVPSWSTILTGMDIDRTGIKGNDVFNRQSKAIDNYLDIRKDIIFPTYQKHSRAYRKLTDSRAAVIYDRMYRGTAVDQEGFKVDQFNQDSEAFMSLHAINDHFPMYLVASLANNLANLDLWTLFGAHDAMMGLFFNYSASTALDRDNVEQTLAVIQDPRGVKKRMIGVYLQGLDHLSHKEHERGRRYLQEVDYEIGRVFQALSASRYRDSVVMLMSDHGSLGGEEFKIDNEYNPLRGENAPLTMTNMSHYFSGSFNKPGYSDYGFNVESAVAAEGKFSLRNLSEIQLQPFQCTNVVHSQFSELHTCTSYFHQQPEKINAAVMSNETVALPYGKFDSGDWTTPNNWYTLTHYVVNRSAGGTPIVRNLIADLENFSLDNLMVFDSDLAQKIGNRPLDWLAIRLDEKVLARSQSARAAALKNVENAILIHKTVSNQALILKSTNSNGEAVYRYLPIKNFQQEANQNVSFDLNDGRDPLDYVGNPWANRNSDGPFSSDAHWLSEYHTDRQWTGRFAKTAFPNTVPALTRFMTFRGPTEIDQNSLRADLYLNPRYGHYFAINNDTNEVNHGMWQRESVRTLLMATGPGIRRGYRAKNPVFTYDIVPSALKAAGYQSDSLNLGRESFWKQFDGRPSLEILE